MYVVQDMIKDNFINVAHIPDMLNNLIDESDPDLDLPNIVHAFQTAERIRYRVFIRYCVFTKNFVIFLNSASTAAALVFYLPGVCTHTDTEGKQSSEYF